MCGWPSLFPYRPNPLTPTLSPLGRGRRMRYRGELFVETSRLSRAARAASLLPHKRVYARLRRAMGEKDRMRGFGRWSFLSNLRLRAPPDKNDRRHGEIGDD